MVREIVTGNVQSIDGNFGEIIMKNYKWINANLLKIGDRFIKQNQSIVYEVVSKYITYDDKLLFTLFFENGQCSMLMRKDEFVKKVVGFKE